jgi:hypothetical protein
LRVYYSLNGTNPCTNHASLNATPSMQGFVAEGLRLHPNASTRPYVNEMNMW